MGEQSYLEAVPAYFATTGEGRSVPFIVSLLLQDASGQARIPPAVEKSIDRTIEITGREGLATAVIADDHAFSLTARRYLDRALDIPGVIVLFRCQSPETAERLMHYLSTIYELTLVREGA